MSVILLKRGFALKNEIFESIRHFAGGFDLSFERNAQQKNSRRHWDTHTYKFKKNFLIFLYSHSILSCSWFHHLIYIIVIVHRNFFLSILPIQFLLFIFGTYIQGCLCVYLNWIHFKRFYFNFIFNHILLSLFLCTFVYGRWSPSPDFLFSQELS